MSKLNATPEASMRQFPDALRKPPYGAFRRSVILKSGPGICSGEVEDDVHHFRIALHHDGEYVLRIAAEAIRVPWLNCPGATLELRRLEGLSLDEITRVLPAARRQHCTHLLDLAILAAGRALEYTMVKYDMELDYSEEGLPCARLRRNGEAMLCWNIDRGIIRGIPFDGVPIADLLNHTQDLGREAQESVFLLRRVSHLGGVRRVDLDAIPNASVIERERLGACFAQQPHRIAEADRAYGNSRDFWSANTWPLEG